MPDFLVDFPGPRPWTLEEASKAGVQPHEFFLGKGRNAVEVAVATASVAPSRPVVRDVWKSRHGNTASPLLLVILYAGNERATLCGPVGPEPLVFEDLEASQAERIAAAALEEPDRHAAVRLIRASLAEVESDLPGLHNVGMFASHELREGVPKLRQWPQATKDGREFLSLSGKDLIQALDFDIEPRGPTTNVLRIRDEGTATAIAVFLDESERPELPGGRFTDSPVSTALARAKSENLRFVVLTRGRTIRIYGADANIGVGRKGRAETYIEANLSLLPAESAGYLPMIFGAGALREGGTFDLILEHSRDFAAGLGARLRDRIYDQVVPDFAGAIARAHQAARPDESIEEVLDDLYETAMVMLFRLLFVAYGEDKGLLPYEANELYRRNALKTTAREMARRANDVGSVPEFDTESTVLWDQVSALWNAVDRGSTEWGVPLYNGGLFSTDPAVSEAGARLSGYTLSNEDIGPALFHLIVDEDEDGIYGPVDFRALSVREFGTIYEGLLESGLSVAREDLTIGKKDRYEPADDDSEVIVEKGSVFLRNTSGARKATGSYFTPHFAVEHLLDHALEPALDRHMQRLVSLVDNDQASEAARQFFNFRIADIAMGSAHFLVAGVDRIEIRFSDFLEEHPLPQVTAELERLRKSAEDNLGPLAGSTTIERSSLLRRQIARRCVYGVDINHVAVELARLSIWIHTFVPGLPLSFLDRTLVHGDSLFGAGNYGGARDLLAPDNESEAQANLFGDQATELIEAARPHLERLAQSSDATESEIRGAREAYYAVRRRLEPLAEALDIAVASKLDERLRSQWEMRVDKLLYDSGFRRPLLRRARSLLPGSRPIHFPLEFAEVFARRDGGFDCIIGNPPWEKPRVEEHSFWARHEAGIRGLSRAERDGRIEELREERPDLLAALEAERTRSASERELLRQYPGMDTGHPDLFRAFTWRYGELMAQGGRVGVVLPGDAFKVTGGVPLRQMFRERFRELEVQLLTNRRGWVFEEVHPQKLIALCSAVRDDRGLKHYVFPEEHDSMTSWLKREPEAGQVSAEWLERYSPELVIPTLPARRSIDLLDVMMNSPAFRDHPDFDVSRIYADFETSRDRDKWVKSPSDGTWPVYKGSSFNIFEPDTGEYYAYTDGALIAEIAHEKRTRMNRTSPYFHRPQKWIDDPNTHPIYQARVAMRHVTNRTNQRTLIACLIPPQVITTETAPWIFFASDDDREIREAFLLGCLSSHVVDWWARRFVEGHFYKDAFACLRIPRWDAKARLQARLIEIAGRFASVDDRFARWATRVGVEVGGIDDDARPELLAELDAVVAHLYGLSEDDLTHVFETFHTGWDHVPHMTRSREHYKKWAERSEEVSA